MIKKRIVWSEEDIKLLKKLWCSYISLGKIRESFPHLLLKDICNKARRSLKLPPRANFYKIQGAWEKEEIELLIVLWKSNIQIVDILKKLPTKNKNQIKYRAKQLKLQNRSEFVYNIDRKWTIEEIKILSSLWITNSEVSFINNSIPSKTPKAIVGKAVRLGLGQRPPDVKSNAMAKKNKLAGRDLSIELLTSIAKSYKTKSEFRRNDSSAYSAASKLGLLGVITFVGLTFNYPQTALFEIVKSIFPKKNVRYNDRTAIKPKELDVYVVEDRIAFEYDGLNYHSDKSDIIKDNIKNHICDEAGIKLYRILEINKNNPIPYILNQLYDYGFDVSLVSIDSIKLKIVKYYKSEQDIKNIINRYDSFTLFRKENDRLYAFLKKNNMCDMLSEIMPKPINEDIILELLKSCKDKQDFFVNHQGLYLRMMKDKKKFNISYLEYLKIPNKIRQLR